MATPYEYPYRPSVNSLSTSLPTVILFSTIPSPIPALFGPTFSLSSLPSAPFPPACPNSLLFVFPGLFPPSAEAFASGLLTGDFPGDCH